MPPPEPARKDEQRWTGPIEGGGIEKSRGSSWQRGSRGHGGCRAWHGHLKNREQGTRSHETKQRVVGQGAPERSASASGQEGAGG